MLDTEILALAQGLYNPLFASRTTIKEAITYAYAIAKISDNPAAVTTALHVVLNTLAEHLETAVRTEHRSAADEFLQWAKDFDTNHNQESREG